MKTRKIQLILALDLDQCHLSRIVKKFDNPKGVCSANLLKA